MVRADSRLIKSISNDDENWFPTGGGKPRPEPAKPKIAWQSKKVPGWEAWEFNALMEQRQREQPRRRGRPPR